MNEQEAHQILAEVARNNGVSVQEVEREIAVAIAEGQENKDPAVRAFWASVPRKGTIPTPAELLRYLMGQEQQVS